jgi:predicted transcriptional regulator
MSRELSYDEPLLVKLEIALKRRLKMEAARTGTDMSKITRQALVEYLDRSERRRKRTEGQGGDLVERMRGRATSQLSTEEIMALTRS